MTISFHRVICYKSATLSLQRNPNYRKLDPPPLLQAKHWLLSNKVTSCNVLEDPSRFDTVRLDLSTVAASCRLIAWNQI